MKNKMGDVRDYLVQALEDLSDKDVDADKMAGTIERAKTISTVAGTYVQAVKVEIEAIRLAHTTGKLPVSVADGTRLIEQQGQTGGKPRLGSG